jgi:hypothetical protein
VSIEIPDFNEYHPIRNFDQMASFLKGQGVPIIIGRAHNGYRADHAFVDHVKAFEKRGIHVVGYGIASDNRSATGTQLGSWLLQVHPPRPDFGRGWVFDLESYNGYMPSASIVDGWRSYLVARCSRTTEELVLYSLKGTGRPGNLGRMAKWYAAYSSSSPGGDLWQHTDGVFGPAPHSVAGFSGDISKLLATASTAMAWVGGGNVALDPHDVAAALSEFAGMGKDPTELGLDLQGAKGLRTWAIKGGHPADSDVAVTYDALTVLRPGSPPPTPSGGLQVGDELTVSLNGVDVTLKVTGFAPAG